MRSYVRRLWSVTFSCMIGARPRHTACQCWPSPPWHVAVVSAQQAGVCVCPLTAALETGWLCWLQDTGTIAAAPRPTARGERKAPYRGASTVSAWAFTCLCNTHHHANCNNTHPFITTTHHPSNHRHSLEINERSTSRRAVLDVVTAWLLPACCDAAQQPTAWRRRRPSRWCRAPRARCSTGRSSSRMRSSMLLSGACTRAMGDSRGGAHAATASARTPARHTLRPVSRARRQRRHKEQEIVCRTVEGPVSISNYAGACAPRTPRAHRRGTHWQLLRSRTRPAVSLCTRAGVRQRPCCRAQPPSQAVRARAVALGREVRRRWRACCAWPCSVGCMPGAWCTLLF
jgi:hypothetical protein